MGDHLVTVLEAGPNVVVQKKTDESDGYTALQLGFGERRPDLFTKAERGHCEKANVAPRPYLCESRLAPGEAEGFEVGQEIKCDIFEAGQKIDVIEEGEWIGMITTEAEGDTDLQMFHKKVMVQISVSPNDEKLAREFWAAVDRAGLAAAVK